jgi:hypothetical protein
MKKMRTLVLATAILLAGLFSCNKEEEQQVTPDVSISNLYLQSSTAIIIHYTSSDYYSFYDGTEFGVCYGLAVDPTINDNFVISQTNNYSSFLVDVIGLSPDTEYYGRAFINDGINTYYSLNCNFTTPKVGIGEFKEGGVVFWVNPNDTAHGLVCAVDDCVNGTSYWASVNNQTNATGTGVGTGQQNTNSILTLSTTMGAARYCDNFISNGFSDWYLPSIDELNIMVAYQGIIDNVANQNGGQNLKQGYYWSSTEYNIDKAYQQNFNTGEQLFYSKIDYNYVRAIRSY